MAIPNSLTDGSYDSPTLATQAAGTMANYQLLLKQFPEAVNDPTIQKALASGDPTQLQNALTIYQKANNPNYDPNNDYKVVNGQVSTTADDDFISRHGTAISALLAAGLTLPAAIAALSGGGAADAAGVAAVDSSGEAASTGVGPLAEGLVDPAVDAGAPAGISAVDPLASTTISGAGALPASVTSGTDLGVNSTSTLGKIASALSGKSGVASILGAAGQGIGAATTAAGNNALNQEKLGLEANQQNITGEEAFQNELLNMAKEEQSQRKGALQDEYLAGFARQPGSLSPAASSPAAMDSLTALEHQAQGTLANPAKYSTNSMAAPTPYTPINVKDVQGSTGTSPSTLQTIGSWLSPALTVASKIAPFVSF